MITFSYHLGHIEVDTKNKHGQTPLMKAVIFDDVELVKLLHKSGKIYFFLERTRFPYQMKLSFKSNTTGSPCGAS